MRKEIIGDTENAHIVLGERPRVLFPWERIDVVAVLEGPSMTKQSFQAECDINTIMKRYEKTGIIDHLSKYGGKYGDFTETVDYQTALNAVIKAENMFMELPAHVRSKFENDPAKFLDYATDPKNLDGMIELGLAPPKAPLPIPDTPADRPVEPDKK